MLRITHTLDKNSYYQFTVSNTSNNDYFSKRKSFDDPSYFTGFKLWYPEDKYSLDNFRLVEGSDKMIDAYQVVQKHIIFADGYNEKDVSSINPLTGFIEGAESNIGSQSPYGLISGYFPVHGNERNFSFRLGNYWQIDGNYNLNIDGDFSHMIKTGFEVRFYENSRHYNSLPWDSNPFFDVYSADWGGNIYTMDDEVYKMTSKPYEPFRASVFIQDQIMYKGIIISPGLRFDLFDPSSLTRKASENFISVKTTDMLEDATIKYQISPRLNITYPITDLSNITISYGMFFKMPSLQRLYDGFAIEQLRGSSILGQPNLEAQRTNQYNISYSNQFVDDMMFSVSAYFKDIYNQTGADYHPATPSGFFQYAISEYGNSKGIEFEIRKAPTNNIGITLNYTLAMSEGTSSAAGTNYNLPLDPYTGKIAYPLAEYTMNWDRRHKINAVLNFFWREGEGPSIAGIHLLENTSINFTSFFQTGTPYTKQDLGGNIIGEINSQRQPSYWRVDMRFSRSFLMRDIFGESAGNSSFEVFFDINNLLNRTAVAALYVRTGDPDDDGYFFHQVKPTQFNATVLYKEGDFVNPSSIDPTQFSSFGDRLYNPYADTDGDGRVVQYEQYEAFVRYLTNAREFRGNYQRPRTVYFGFMFKF